MKFDSDKSIIKVYFYFEISNYYRNSFFSNENYKNLISKKLNFYHYFKYFYFSRTMINY